MEGDAARADLLGAEVVDGDGAAHVAVESEREVVLALLGPLLKGNREGKLNFPPFPGEPQTNRRSRRLLRRFVGGRLRRGRVVRALGAVRPVAGVFVLWLVNQREVEGVPPGSFNLISELGYCV